MGELDNIIEWLARDILGQKAIMIKEHILLFRFLLNIINFIYLYIYIYIYIDIIFLIYFSCFWDAKLLIKFLYSNSSSMSFSIDNLGNLLYLS